MRGSNAVTVSGFPLGGGTHPSAGASVPRRIHFSHSNRARHALAAWGVALCALLLPGSAWTLDCLIDNGDFETSPDSNWTETCERQGADKLVVKETDAGHNSSSGLAKFTAGSIAGIDQTLTQPVDLPVSGIDSTLWQNLLPYDFTGLDQSIWQEPIIIPIAGIDTQTGQSAVQPPFTVPHQQQLIYKDLAGTLPAVGSPANISFEVQIANGGDWSDTLELKLGSATAFMIRGNGEVAGEFTPMGPGNPVGGWGMFAGTPVVTGALSFEATNVSGKTVFYVDDVKVNGIPIGVEDAADWLIPVVSLPGVTQNDIIRPGNAFSGNNSARFGVQRSLSFMLRIENNNGGDRLQVKVFGTPYEIADNDSRFAANEYREVSFPIPVETAIVADAIEFKYLAGERKSVFWVDKVNTVSYFAPSLISCGDFTSGCANWLPNDMIVKDLLNNEYAARIAPAKTWLQFDLRVVNGDANDNGALEVLLGEVGSETGTTIMRVNSLGAATYSVPLEAGSATNFTSFGTVKLNVSGFSGTPKRLQFKSRITGPCHFYVDNVSIQTLLGSPNPVLSGSFDDTNSEVNWHPSPANSSIIDTTNKWAHFGSDLLADIIFYVTIKKTGDATDTFKALLGGETIFSLKGDGTLNSTPPEDNQYVTEILPAAGNFSTWTKVTVRLPLAKLIGEKELKFMSTDPGNPPTEFGVDNVSVQAWDTATAQQKELVQNGGFENDPDTGQTVVWDPAKAVKRVPGQAYAGLRYGLLAPGVGATTRLQFQFRIETPKGNPSDTFTVSLAGTQFLKASVDATGNVVFTGPQSVPDPAAYTGKYGLMVLDVSSVTGGVQTLQFASSITGSTKFYVDSVCAGTNCPTTNRLADGEFNDASKWTPVPSYPAIVQDVGSMAYTTPKAAVFGIPPEKCELSQSIYVPLNRSILVYYLKIPKGVAPGDQLVVTVGGDTLATYDSTTSATGEYKQRSISLVPYISTDDNDKTEIKFTSTIANGSSTEFLLDDVCLGVGTGDFLKILDCEITPAVLKGELGAAHTTVMGKEFTVILTISNLYLDASNLLVIKPALSDVTDQLHDELVAVNPPAGALTNTITASFTVPGTFVSVTDAYDVDHRVCMDGLASVYVYVGGVFVGPGINEDLIDASLRADGGMNFIIDTTPPQIVIGEPSGPIPAYSFITDHNSGGGDTIDCGMPAWRGQLPVPYSNATFVSPGTEGPQVFFRTPGALNFTFTMTFIDPDPVDAATGEAVDVEHAGFCGNTAGLPVLDTTRNDAAGVADVLAGYSRAAAGADLEADIPEDVPYLPGTAHWVNVGGSGGFAGADARMKLTLNDVWDQMIVNWEVDNLSFDAAGTSWHRSATFDVVDLAGNQAATDKFQFWWMQDPHATLLSGPAGQTIADPEFTWDLYRDGGEVPASADPCKPLASIRLWTAPGNDPPLPTTSWTAISDWSCWWDSKTINSLWDMGGGISLGAKLVPIPDRWVLLTILGADEAGNLQSDSGLGTSTTMAQLAVKDIEYMYWRTVGANIALDTTLNAQFWYNIIPKNIYPEYPCQPVPNNDESLRTRSQGETSFGSATRIPLVPADVCDQRIEAEFTITPGLSDSVLAAVANNPQALYAQWELYEDSRLVASGRVEFKNMQAKLYVPSDILFLRDQQMGKRLMAPSGFAMYRDMNFAAFLNRPRSICCYPDLPCPPLSDWDRLGDDGNLQKDAACGNDPDTQSHRRRDVNYTFTAWTVVDPEPGNVLDDVVDSTPASIPFTVFVEAPVRDEQPVKMINRE